MYSAALTLNTPSGPLPVQPGVVAWFTLDGDPDNAKVIYGAIMDSSFGTGRARFEFPNLVPEQGASSGNIYVSIPGYNVLSAPSRAWVGQQPAEWGTVELEPTGVDPFKVPTEALRAFRGAIFTARSNVPFGPRPDQDSNILAMDEALGYTPSQQDQMLRDYRSGIPIGGSKPRNYRHATFTPGPPSNGYHGQYGLQPDLRATIPQHKALLQSWWNAGAYPVLFCLNADDGYPLTIEGTDALDRDFGDAYRALGGLIQIVVPGGWEPGGYNVSNAQWVYRFQWAKRTFPNARVFGLHMYSDFDAPIGGDDGEPPINMTKQEAWSNLAAAGLTSFLDQVGGYTSSDNEVPTAQFISDFQDRCRYFINHFTAWGIDVDYVGFEFAAFADYWRDFGEQYAQQLGDAIMSAGAKGYGDGGTV